MEDLLRAPDVFMKMFVVVGVDRHTLWYTLTWYSAVGLIKPPCFLDQYCSSNNAKYNEESEDDQDVNISIFHPYIVIQQYVFAIYPSVSLARLVRSIELSQ